MTQLKTVIKMLMQAGAGWSTEGDKKEKKKTNKVVVLFLIFIVIPLALALGFISFYMAFLLNGSGKESSVLSFGIGIAGMTMLFFGILMVPSVFYFSDDITNMIPLPIKPINIINAKFFTTYIWENFTAIFVFLPMMIGYAIGTTVEWYYWVYGIIVLATISLIPMLYGIIVNILLIRFTSFGRNKNLLSYVTSTFSIVLSVGISVYLLNNLYSGNGNVFYTLALSSNSFADILTKIFPFIPYASDAMANGNVISLGIYLLQIIGFMTVYYIVAKLFYFDGVLKLTSGNKNGKAVTDKHIKKKSKRHSQIYSLVKKEFINLFINPSYFSACISSNLICPLLLILIPRTNLWNMIDEYFNVVMFPAKREACFLIFFIGLALLSSGMNYIASTAISREGSDYQAMKYLPIEYEYQILAKMIASYIVSAIVFAVSSVIFCHYMKVNSFTVLNGVVIGNLLMVLMIELEVWLDLYNPTLTWDDEQKAVKQNFNGMLGIILSVVVAVGLGFILLKFLKYIGTIEFALILLLILIVGVVGIKVVYYSDKYFEMM